jgi:hypothetical protein
MVLLLVMCRQLLPLAHQQPVALPFYNQLLLLLLLLRPAPATGAGTCVLLAGQTRSGQS